MPVKYQALICLLCALAAPLLVVADTAGKVAHLGYMSPGDIPQYDNAFLKGLERQGYIMPGEIQRYDEALWRSLVKQGFFQGKKIRIEIRATADRYPARAPEMAAELVRLNLNVLFVSTTPEAKAAEQAVQRSHKALPIVFGPNFDPVGAGLVASLARPGGNVTGLVLNDPELMGKRLELLIEAVPNASRFVYLHEPAVLTPVLDTRTKRAVRAVAGAKRVHLDILEVRVPNDIDRGLEVINRDRAEAIIVMEGPLLLTARKRIIDFATKSRLPAMYGAALFVEEGGLMFYGPPYTDVYASAAAVVAKVLRGTSPADVPVEQPNTHKLLINSQARRDLDLTIPESILLRAEMITTVEHNTP